MSLWESNIRLSEVLTLVFKREKKKNGKRNKQLNNCIKLKNWCFS